MNYASIKKRDIANGPGVRVTLFVSGCTHHCPACFNEVVWDFNYGEPFTKAVEDELLEMMAPDYVAGMTLLGGEPFEPSNQRGLLPFVRRVKERYPNKPLWCYSGYTLEELTGESRARCEVTDELLALIDVLVDGRFILAQKNIRLRFRGSENQRLIDMNKTRAAGKIVLWDDQ